MEAKTDVSHHHVHFAECEKTRVTRLLLSNVLGENVAFINLDSSPALSPYYSPATFANAGNHDTTELLAGVENIYWARVVCRLVNLGLVRRI
jgi:hypothetical protein